MTESICRYSGDRDQAIVSYLYGDEGGFDLAERTAFDAHLATCDRCRTELAAFDGVRESLGSWSPPGPRFQDRPGFGVAIAEPPFTSRLSPASSRQSWWREMPGWAQAAAALLCLGVGAGFANLDVRYDGDGLRVRTGWSAVAPAPVAQNNQPVADHTGGDAPWRAELTALEQRLRADLRQTTQNATNAAASSGTLANAESVGLLRHVGVLIDDSERRQQTELALRLGEAVREMNAQRQADLVRIDRNIGAMQNNTGREMLRQRNEMLNYVSVRTAAQRPQ